MKQRISPLTYFCSAVVSKYKIITKSTDVVYCSNIEKSELIYNAIHC